MRCVGRHDHHAAWTSLAAGLGLFMNFLDATTIVNRGLQRVVGANCLTMAMLMMDVGITSRAHGFIPTRLTLG